MAAEQQLEKCSHRLANRRRGEVTMFIWSSLLRRRDNNQVANCLALCVCRPVDGGGEGREREEGGEEGEESAVFSGRGFLCVGLMAPSRVRKKIFGKTLGYITWPRRVKGLRISNKQTCVSCAVSRLRAREREPGVHGAGTSSTAAHVPMLSPDTWTLSLSSFPPDHTTSSTQRREHGQEPLSLRWWRPTSGTWERLGSSPRGAGRTQPCRCCSKDGVAFERTHYRVSHSNEAFSAITFHLLSISHSIESGEEQWPGQTTGKAGPEVVSRQPGAVGVQRKTVGQRCKSRYVPRTLPGTAAVKAGTNAPVLSLPPLHTASDAEDRHSVAFPATLPLSVGLRGLFGGGCKERGQEEPHLAQGKDDSRAACRLHSLMLFSLPH
ncbi:unnamed protein product [Pleuronectes platessa]|uniref:Uncharacterized protein n=1 Tax=Pleuronectes platessa TaxID=8262 RepID=A0A9N7U2K9_PLEPL|nr:unnamed protein product [Pleuronectes platessa]